MSVRAAEIANLEMIPAQCMTYWVARKVAIDSGKIPYRMVWLGNVTPYLGSSEGNFPPAHASMLSRQLEVNKKERCMIPSADNLASVANSQKFDAANFSLLAACLVLVCRQ